MITQGDFSLLSYSVYAQLYVHVINSVIVVLPIKAHFLLTGLISHTILRHVMSLQSATTYY